MRGFLFNAHRWRLTDSQVNLALSSSILCFRFYRNVQWVNLYIVTVTKLKIRYFIFLSYDEPYFYCLRRAIIPIFYGKCNNKSRECNNKSWECNNETWRVVTKTQKFSSASSKNLVNLKVSPSSVKYEIFGWSGNLDISILQFVICCRLLLSERKMATNVDFFNHNKNKNITSATNTLSGHYERICRPRFCCCLETLHRPTTTTNENANKKVSSNFADSHSRYSLGELKQ